MNISMSSKFPMVSIDKVEVKLTMKAETVVKIEKITKMTGLSRAAIINGYVDDALASSGIKMTKEDYEHVEAIKAENRARRERMASKKGAKHA